MPFFHRLSFLRHARRFLPMIPADILRTVNNHSTFWQQSEPQEIFDFPFFTLQTALDLFADRRSLHFTPQSSKV